MKQNFKLWLKAALIRAAKTMAQTAVASISSNVVFSTINWCSVASTVLVAGILSILMSIQGLPEVENKK